MCILDIIDALEAFGILGVLVDGDTWLPCGVRLVEAPVPALVGNSAASVFTHALSRHNRAVAVEASIRVGDSVFLDAPLYIDAQPDLAFAGASVKTSLSCREHCRHCTDGDNNGGCQRELHDELSRSEGSENGDERRRSAKEKKR